MNPSRGLVTGAICGVRVEEIEDPVMQGEVWLLTVGLARAVWP